MEVNGGWWSRGRGVLTGNEMDRQAVEDALKDALNRYAGLPLPITLDESIMETVDSLTQAEIVMSLEDRFSITVPDEEVDHWTLQEIIDYFEKNA